jgi:hypothetical protein
MGWGCAAMQCQEPIIWLRSKVIAKGVNTDLAQFASIFTDEAVVAFDYISVFPCSTGMVIWMFKNRGSILFK